VCPDIVTTGKPIANGFPLSAVVTRREIAESLDMSYFNTFVSTRAFRLSLPYKERSTYLTCLPPGSCLRLLFSYTRSTPKPSNRIHERLPHFCPTQGGNNLAMAMGEETLDIILSENLQANAHLVSQHCTKLMADLRKKHAIIGDVRGLGLMMGIELVTDQDLKTPAPEAAAFVLKRARQMGVHIQVDGTYENVLKMKPPMVFTIENANTLMQTIDAALTEFANLMAHQKAETPTDKLELKAH
jgi:4-aminobutyrate aminotransferase-like enzyme